VNPQSARCNNKVNYVTRLEVSHSGVAEDTVLLRCDGVLGVEFPTFRRTQHPHFQCPEPADEGTVNLRNVRNYIT